MDTLRNKCKSALIPLLLLVMALVLCACGDKSQFEVNDDNGYTVSVKFDANGGEFTTNCYEIVDSFNIAGMATNSEGMVELALIAPDNSIRGANDTFTVAKNGYFLAGWYEVRNEVVDANGNVTYTYSGTLSLEDAFSCGANDDMYALIREIFYENQEGLFDGYAEEDLVYKNIRVFRVREDQTARIEYEAYNVKLEDLAMRVDRMLDHVNNELDIFHEAVDEECGE